MQLFAASMHQIGIEHGGSIGTVALLAACLAAAELAHTWIVHHRIHVGHLLPELPWCPSHAVLMLAVADNVAPVAGATFRAKELLQPLVIEYQYRIGLYHKSGSFVAHAPLFELFRCQQMEVILPAIAAQLLLRVSRAAQVTTLGPPACPRLSSTRIGMIRRNVGHRWKFQDYGYPGVYR